MTSELDPSILTPHELSKLNKKALIENLTVLQGKYNVQSKKYGVQLQSPLTNQHTHADKLIR